MLMVVRGVPAQRGYRSVHAPRGCREGGGANAAGGAGRGAQAADPQLALRVLDNLARIHIFLSCHSSASGLPSWSLGVHFKTGSGDMTGLSRPCFLFSTSGSHCNSLV